MNHVGLPVHIATCLHLLVVCMRPIKLQQTFCQGLEWSLYTEESGRFLGNEEDHFSIDHAVGVDLNYIFHLVFHIMLISYHVSVLYHVNPYKLVCSLR